MTDSKVIKKLITISGSGSIPELGYITAPIINPTRVSIDKIARMVGRGAKVYEVNPDNRSEKVLLTVSNVKSDNFKKAATTAKTETKTEAKVETKVETKVEPKTEAKTTAKVETKTEAKSESKSDFATK